jgi:hypothetical protein
MEVTASDKHSCLLWYIIHYDCKMFHNLYLEWRNSTLALATNIRQGWKWLPHYLWLQQFYLRPKKVLYLRPVDKLSMKKASTKFLWAMHLMISELNEWAKLLMDPDQSYKTSFALNYTFCNKLERSLKSDSFALVWHIWVEHQKVLHSSNLQPCCKYLTCGLYYKHILTIVSDDHKWRLYYKCAYDHNWRC